MYLDLFKNDVGIAPNTYKSPQIPAKVQISLGSVLAARRDCNSLMVSSTVASTSMQIWPPLKQISLSTKSLSRQALNTSLSASVMIRTHGSHRSGTSWEATNATQKRAKMANFMVGFGCLVDLV